jgi:hypothetical protein
MGSTACEEWARTERARGVICGKAGTRVHAGGANGTAGAAAGTHSKSNHDPQCTLAKNNTTSEVMHAWGEHAQRQRIARMGHAVQRGNNTSPGHHANMRHNMYRNMRRMDATQTKCTDQVGDGGGRDGARAKHGGAHHGRGGPSTAALLLARP